MFIGIIEELGRIKGIVKKSGNTGLAIEGKITLEEAKIGDSISVNGTCLTIAEIKKNLFRVDVSPETLRSTNLGELRIGDRVNLERAARLSDRIGGHIVTGHVDSIGIIREKRTHGDSSFYRIEAPKEVLRYVVLKGSIAVDGISLTITDLTESDFGLVIIPHTSTITTMGFKKVGDKVNLEVDILGKYVERVLLYRESKGITMDSLKEYGFIERINS
jgi:riboflavin synthase